LRTNFYARVRRMPPSSRSVPITIRCRVMFEVRRSAPGGGRIDAVVGMTRDDCGIDDDASITELHSEADEIIAIFVTMVSRIRKNKAK